MITDDPSPPTLHPDIVKFNQTVLNMYEKNRIEFNKFKTENSDIINFNPITLQSATNNKTFCMFSCKRHRHRDGHEGGEIFGLGTVIVKDPTGRDHTNYKLFRERMGVKVHISSMTNPVLVVNWKFNVHNTNKPNDDYQWIRGHFETYELNDMQTVELYSMINRVTLPPTPITDIKIDPFWFALRLLRTQCLHQTVMNLSRQNHSHLEKLSRDPINHINSYLSEPYSGGRQRRHKRNKTKKGKTTKSI